MATIQLPKLMHQEEKKQTQKIRFNKHRPAPPAGTRHPTCYRIRLGIKDYGKGIIEL
jgi:hypothetical protein